MGIRIHKVLGYGLTDVKVKDYNIVDDRFNLDSPYFTDREEFREISKYQKWLIKQPDDEMHQREWEDRWVNDVIKRESHIGVDDCFIHQGEFGLPKVFLVIPFAGYLGNWFRHDDIIDWVECSLTGKGPKDSCKKIKGGIYPYSGCYMDAKDGRRIQLLNGEGVDFIKRLEDGDKRFALAFAKKLGFRNLEEAYQRIAPILPEGVVYLCQYANIFKDAKTVYQLRPLLYTYWS